MAQKVLCSVPQTAQELTARIAELHAKSHETERKAFLETVQAFEALHGKVAKAKLCKEGNDGKDGELATFLHDHHVKWGDLCAFNGKLCRSLIQRYNMLPHMFTHAGEALKMKNMTSLKWIVDRFVWKHPYCADSTFFSHTVLYDAALQHLQQDDEDLFEEFMLILWNIIKENFKAHHIVVVVDVSEARDGDDVDRRNLLRECVRADKLAQLKFLLHLFKVDSTIIKNLAREFPDDNNRAVTYLQHRALFQELL